MPHMESGVSIPEELKALVEDTASQQTEQQATGAQLAFGFENGTMFVEGRVTSASSYR